MALETTGWFGPCATTKSCSFPSAVRAVRNSNTALARATESWWGEPQVAFCSGSLSVWPSMPTNCPVKTRVTSAAAWESSAVPAGTSAAVPGSKSLSAGNSMRTTLPSRRVVAPGIARCDIPSSIDAGPMAAGTGVA